jgi:hypothetical protein
MTEAPQNHISNLPKLESRADFKLYGSLRQMMSHPVSVPGVYVFDLNISDEALRFWIRLNTITNIDQESWWKQKTMAKMFNLSEESVKRYVKELASARLIEKGKKRESRSNCYRLVWPEGCIDPRITAAKKKAETQELQEKLNNQNNASYKQRDNNGFSKAFDEKSPSYTQ